MTSDRVTRRVYSAEELHRLRGTCSQPKLLEAIEQHEGEDAELVKEHVLRGSKSFAARSFRSRASGNSLRVPSSNKENRSTNAAENRQSSSDQQTVITGPVLGEIAPNGQVLRPPTLPYKLRPSPTPSLKKKKAEAIVKAHGSPQHIRVTAGGRIVPSEQSPLCHPRYGYSAIKTNGGLIKFAPNHPTGKSQWTQATQNGFVAQDVNGRLCQIVNGTILPLNEVDGALRLYVPAPNLNITSRRSSVGQQPQGRFDASGIQQCAPSQSKPVDPPLPAQTNALELEYSKLEHELKELDKTEVLHGRTMGKAAKEALVGKRCELIITLDNIRKAIKSIKAAALPLEAPLSPRPMAKQQSTSPPRSRLPAFLQQRAQQNNEMNMPPMPPTYNQFYGMAQPPQFNGQYGFQTTPSPDAPYPQGFGMPPHAVFVLPPPFDGSMAPPFAPYPDSNVHGVSAQQAPQPNGTAAPTAVPNSDNNLPQNDGTRSFADLHKVGSPRLSRALDIKAPEPRPAMALKSTLNPMSPAYKPGAGLLKAASNVDRPAPKAIKDRVPTPLLPLHQLRPSAAANKASNATDDTSPTKKSPHLHSSSISSFETADFFPRNTREYSTRKYAYPEQSEDKENVDPLQSEHKSERSPATPISDDRGSDAFKPKNGPKAPRGTPVVPDDSNDKPQLPLRMTNIDEVRHSFDFAAVPDRQVHNLSPKHKRQDFLFVEEHPSQYGSQASSSPEKYKTCLEEPSVVSSPPKELDLSEQSSDWIEGYRAGLACKAVPSDRMGDFLDGYCAGLLKSKPAATHGASTGSPVKSNSRRPNPAIVQSRSSSRLQSDRRDAVTSRPPFENQLQSMDTLKEAVYAPQNETALLSPTADTPLANDAQFNLGAWAKSQEQGASMDTLVSPKGDGLAGFPFPHRTSSMMKRQGIVSESDVTAERQDSVGPHGNDARMRVASITSQLSAIPQFVASATTDRKSIDQSTSYNPSNRISSMTSIDSNLYRQWPGHRVFTPHLEYKSVSSVAQAAGLAAGYFANVQFDGVPQSQREASMTSNPVVESHSRFKEGSLDGITNPPNSPQIVSPPISPTVPPKDSLGKDSKKKDSPGKGYSPSKVKFEHIAEKVGIKVTVGKKEDGSSPNSPPGKRRWRDVWRGGAKKEMSREDEKPLTLA